MLAVHTGDMEIRRATADDWRASRDIRLRALADSPDAFMSTLERESAFDDEVWMSRLDSSHTAFAVEGGVPVGVAVLVGSPVAPEIVAMWVDPSFRGRGVAGALVEHLVEQAIAGGANSVALWVADGNDGARRVYERCGFVATGERDVIRPGLGEARMRRSLG